MQPSVYASPIGTQDTLQNEAPVTNNKDTLSFVSSSADKSGFHIKDLAPRPSDHKSSICPSIPPLMLSAGMKASPLREIQKEKEPLQLQDNKVCPWRDVVCEWVAVLCISTIHFSFFKCPDMCRQYEQLCWEWMSHFVVAFLYCLTPCCTNTVRTLEWTNCFDVASLAISQRVYWKKLSVEVHCHECMQDGTTGILQILA